MHARLEDAAQKPVTMMGLSIIEALQFYGFSRVAVASIYYTQEICDRYTAFRTSRRVRVQAMQNFPLGPDPRGEGDGAAVLLVSAQLADQAGRKVAAQAPESDCILLTGGAVHTMDLIEALEADLDKPVITSDSAFFWSLLGKLGIRERLEGWGHLLARFADS